MISLDDFQPEYTYNESLKLYGRVMRDNGTGYHSFVPPGTVVHPTRENLRFAQQLLHRNEPDSSFRACEVIAAVLREQQGDPTHDAYGVWPWFVEENCDQMAPPDKNWAAFNGAFLLTMLCRHADQIPPTLQKEMEDATRQACYSIFRRNVGPDYTNIALMTAAVTLCFGEKFQHPIFFEFGKTLLEKFRRFTWQQGSFAEYNSPTYTMVALEEIERILMLVKDTASREIAEELRFHAWDLISNHYHPATGQWAGPHLRSYSDTLTKGKVGQLSAYTGQTLHWYGKPGETEKLSAPPDALFREVDLRPCPEVFIHRFQTLEKPGQTRVTPFTQARPNRGAFIGSTWMSERACLSTVNLCTTWTQTYGNIGYWVDDDALYSMRLRMLNGERDFSSFTLTQAQADNAVLSLLRPVKGLGNWHPLLDVPADGVFTTTDLRLSLEIRGPDLAVIEETRDYVVLRGGNHLIELHLGPATFMGLPGSWSCQQKEGKLCLQCVLLPGTVETRWEESLTNSGMGLAFALDSQSKISAPTWTPDDQNWQAAWKLGDTSLAVSQPPNTKSW